MRTNLENLTIGLVLTVLGVVLSYTLLKHAGGSVEVPGKGGAPAQPAPVAARKLLYFGGSWCLPCKKMATTLSDPKVVKAMLDTRTPITKYDVDKDRDLATRYAIKSVPTYLILDGSGKEIRRATGYKSAADFAAWLTP